jgi:DNA-binding transcriptional MerR regulator
VQKPLTVGAAARETGWSARMLRYLEDNGLVAPQRTPSGYRLYGLSEVNRLRNLRDLRRRFGLELRVAVDAFLAAGEDASSWVEWEQRKHERLLAA